MKAAVELLNRVDEVLSFKRSTEILKHRTAALERLPTKECQGLSSAKFRLDPAGMTNRNLIDAELAMSEAKRLVADVKGRVKGSHRGGVKGDHLFGSEAVSL